MKNLNSWLFVGHIWSRQSPWEKPWGRYPYLQMEVTDAQENILHTPSTLVSSSAASHCDPFFSFFPMTLHGTTPDQSLRTQMHPDTYSHMHISADMQCHPDGGGNLCLPRECTPPPTSRPPSRLFYQTCDKRRTSTHHIHDIPADGRPYLNVNR